MKTLFADTGYWIAILYSKDPLHDVAKETSQRLFPFRVITTDWVLNELLNSFSKKDRRLRELAASFVESLQDDPNVEITPATPQLFDRALGLYRDRPDSAWSHTDCISFCVMGDRQIREALAHDRHFEQAGFVALLRQSD
ncbi:MAG: PIN domain-containing protein [Cyanobacteria bacterium]|nr:PIN domain-containing protein [Cyanobacteriota bacterium]